MVKLATPILLLCGMAIVIQAETECGALKSKWKCTPSRSCDWYKEFVKNLGKYSTGDQKFKELKDFYDDRKCAEGHVYCSSDGKFPRESGDLPKLKKCQVSVSPAVAPAVESQGVGCGALESKWKCTPSRSCDWYKEFVKNLGKTSTSDPKFKKLKDFYDERKCRDGHVYCSSDGKFPRDNGDLPKLKRCQLSPPPSVDPPTSASEPTRLDRPNPALLRSSSGCGALETKWKCTPSRSCDWYKEFVKNLGKTSTSDPKFKELKDFYDERKCADGHVYCSSDGKFPRDGGDLPKLKRCKVSHSALLARAEDCTDIDMAHCPLWARSGYCGKYGGYVIENCQKSCGKCGRDGCNDIQEVNCPRWAEKGFCGQYNGYVTKNCQKSCKKCGPGVTGPSCGKIFNLKSADLEEMHNSWRSKVANNSLENKLGEQAKNMNMLTWDSTLAEQAQRWANQCKDGHSPKDQRPDSGENSYVYATTGDVSKVDAGKRALDDWAKERSYTTIQDLIPFTSVKKSEGDIGHWTAMIWADTTKVGCGAIEYQGDSDRVSGKTWNWVRVICQYKSEGNIVNKNVFEKGAPCSGCTGGCKEGLCT